MNQSKLLGSLQMTHSHYIKDQRSDDDTYLQKQEQEQMTKTLAFNARKSYAAHKSKMKPNQSISQQVIKSAKRAKIFHDKLEADPTASKLPNYNLLEIQQIGSSKASNNCFCSGLNTGKIYQIVIEQPCRIIAFQKGSYTKIGYVFNLDTVEAQVRQQFSHASNQFLFIVGDLTLKISHNSKSIIKAWYDHLRKMINDSYGKSLKMQQLPLKYPNKFHKIIFATEDEFTQNCQTGDILLFQDQHFFARAQRFITNSDYDHVAMIIRDKTFGILMFEANSLSGVSLTPWNCMIKYGWYKYISRIVWRKLQNVERTKFFQSIIHKFVKENLKADYYISVNKLVSNKSYIGVEKEPKGFFCSQLIATVYKDLQIMTRNQKNQKYMPACKVYPYHFSEKYDLGLEIGNLSLEHQIHFNKELMEKSYGEFAKT